MTQEERKTLEDLYYSHAILSGLRRGEFGYSEGGEG